MQAQLLLSFHKFESKDHKSSRTLEWNVLNGISPGAVLHLGMPDVTR